MRPSTPQMHSPTSKEILRLPPKTAIQPTWCNMALLLTTKCILDSSLLLFKVNSNSKNNINNSVIGVNFCCRYLTNCCSVSIIPVGKFGSTQNYFVHLSINLKNFLDFSIIFLLHGMLLDELVLNSSTSCS